MNLHLVDANFKVRKYSLKSIFKQLHDSYHLFVLFSKTQMITFAFLFFSLLDNFSNSVLLIL